MAVTTNINPAATPAPNILILLFLRATFLPALAAAATVSNTKLPKPPAPTTNVPETVNAAMTPLHPLAYPVPLLSTNYANHAVHQLMSITAQTVSIPKNLPEMSVAVNIPNVKATVLMLDT